MTEFCVERGEFTHGLLADGGVQKVAFEEGTVSISRFGVFSYYQISTPRAVGRCRIVAQQRPEVRLIFISKGQHIHIGCNRQTKTFSAGESNCLLVKEGCVQEVVMKDAGVVELFMLVVGLPDISLPTVDAQPRLRDFLNARRCTWLLDALNMVVGMRKIGVIQQILHEKKPAYLQAAYIQLKLAELFVLFLERAGRLNSGNEPVVQLRPEEVERVRKVRDMLQANPAASYSLVGLAHTVGTNETTLKTHFKAVYGVTVFGYLTACRMERAKALLEKEQLKVAVVAQEVGYKYASHFSTAFRKYFGYLPTKLLRVIISIPAYLSTAVYPEVL